ncbi:MAG: DUF3368 domain-containing protein [Methylococcales bacterium]|nr:DUF3368 domain-containing protein [Methylococcales bacterium]
MKVVSNTTPIISLASIGKLSLLPELFGKIYIPQAVHDEIKSKKSYGYQEIDNPDFEVVSIQGNDYLGFLLNELDKGEAEAIFLAKEIKAEILIIDERMGYKIAQSQSLYSIGTLTVLQVAKEKQLIKNVKPLLDELIKKGRWYSEAVYTQFLKQVGE